MMILKDVLKLPTALLCTVKKNIAHISIILLSIFCQINLSAQEKFDLEQRSGHFYFKASINDTPVELMLESGIPALLVGDDVYETSLKSSDLIFEASKGKMRLLNKLYDIVYRAEGEVAIGNALYVGPIFILQDYDGVSIPIQHLKDADTRKSVVTIDLINKYLLVGESEDKPAGKKYKLSFDKELGFPVISAKIDITTPEGKAKLNGSLIVDFGNPSLLFLRKQHKSIEKSIAKKNIELKDAYDKQGNLVAQGIYAKTVSMLGHQYSDISIGVTDKMQNLSHLGFLGIPFFSTSVVFDFDKGFMIVSR